MFSRNYFSANYFAPQFFPPAVGVAGILVSVPCGSLAFVSLLLVPINNVVIVLPVQSIAFQGKVPQYSIGFVLGARRIVLEVTPLGRLRLSLKP